MTETQKLRLKWIGSGLGIVIALITFMWKFDTVYARDAKVDSHQFLMEKRIEGVEIQTVKTFEMIQRQIDTSVREMERNNHIADLNRQLNYLTEHKYELKAMMKKHPEDDELRNELAETKYELEKVKEALNKLLLGK